MNLEALISTQTKRQTNSKYGSSVLTSRIRLARNLRGHSFPGWATKQERKKMYADIVNSLEKLSFAKGSFFKELSSLSAQEKKLLVEQHLMSRELAARGEGCGILVTPSKGISIMINEEDHFRLQSMQPGLSLKKSYNAIEKIDTHISGELGISYDPKLGYLTSCPTNLGTGMRASVMLYLPTLAHTKEINRVFKAVSKLGLAIRGFYGEGTDSYGHFYQISNQSTLGQNEAEIISRIERIVKYVITAEENSRKSLLEKDYGSLKDQIGRAYGTLKHAFKISSQEALELLSFIRLGVQLSSFPEEVEDVCDKLLVEIQSAHLQHYAGETLDGEARDERRAFVISEYFAEINPPSI